MAVKKQSISKIKAKADKLWSQLIRMDGSCEICGTSENLNAHHIISRAKLHTRYMKENGICLCVGHHMFNKDISAHGNSVAFVKWFVDKYGQERLDFLLKESNSTEPFRVAEYRQALEDLEFLINNQ